MSQELLEHIEGGIATLTLNRPESRNAMTRAMLIELERSLARLAADRSVRLVVLTGAGGVIEFSIPLPRRLKGLESTLWVLLDVLVELVGAARQRERDEFVHGDFLGDDRRVGVEVRRRRGVLWKDEHVP